MVKCSLIALTVACTIYSTNASRLRIAQFRRIASKLSTKRSTCDANAAGSSANKCAVPMKPCIYGCDNCQSVCYPCASLYADFKCATEGAQPGQTSYETCRNIDYACGSYWGSSCQGEDAAIECLGWKGTCIQYSDNVTAGCSAPENATKGHITTSRHPEGEPKAITYALQALSGVVNLLFLKQLLTENVKKWRGNGQGQERAREIDPSRVERGGEGPRRGRGGDGHGGDDDFDGEETKEEDPDDDPIDPIDPVDVGGVGL